MEETARDITEISRRINVHFDSVREELKKLQALLDQLGNPGCTFCDDNKEQVHIHSGDYWFRLEYKNGKLGLKRTSFTPCIPDRAQKNDELHQIPIDCVVATLKRLPTFLSNYKTFLEEKKEVSELTQKMITKIAEAITVILEKK